MRELARRHPRSGLSAARAWGCVSETPFFWKIGIKVPTWEGRRDGKGASRLAGAGTARWRLARGRAVVV